MNRGLTLRHVNAELAKLGAAERLAKGKGYFYFYDGDADSWFGSSVPVYRINQLTLAQWIATWKAKKEDSKHYEH